MRHPRQVVERAEQQHRVLGVIGLGELARIALRGGKARGRIGARRPA
jgi:hypothetical protein